MGGEKAAQKDLTASDKNGTIKSKEDKVREEIIPNLITNVLVPRQAIHRQGSRLYLQRQRDLQAKNQYGPSYLTISDEEILELVRIYKGTGRMNFSRKTGEWNRQEVILNNDKIVGVVYDNMTGASAETTVFKIHYSDDGVHIVPDYPSKKRKRGGNNENQ